MTVRAGLLLLGLLLACAQDPRQTPAPGPEAWTRILDTSAAGDSLLAAARGLIASDDPRALPALFDRLGDAGFLARLDDLSDAHVKTRRLRAVFDALAARPGPGTEAGCLTLAADPGFLADPDRLALLLPALAAVRPMSADTASLFERTNAEGYFAFNLPLLTANGGPRALALFADMVADTTVPAARRVDALHASVVPHRADPALVEAAADLVRRDLGAEVTAGLVESLFDYRPREWFGTSGTAPAPPAWETAPEETLRRLLDIADAALGTPLPEDLSRRMREERAVIASVLASR